MGDLHRLPIHPNNLFRIDETCIFAANKNIMETKVALLQKMKSNFDKILTEAYIPKGIQAKKMSLDA